jgi:hypothetical protein
MMRRASTCLAVLGLALLVLPGVASATPTVKLRGEAVPIPGFPNTGNILGAGADVKVELTIEGSEYFGSPPPVIGVNAYLPKGVVLHPSGFPTCPEEAILKVGPSACPKGSSAGPVGAALGFVTFGGERVEEGLEIFSFFKAGGGIEFFADGHTPTSIEIISKGRYIHLQGAAGYGPEVEVEVPLVPSVPGAPYASVRTITGQFGAAIKSHGKTIYYGRVPTKCHGGFPAKTEVIFAENGEPSRPEPVTAYFTAPCPPRKSSR